MLRPGLAIRKAKPDPSTRRSVGLLKTETYVRQLDGSLQNALLGVGVDINERTDHPRDCFIHPPSVEWDISSIAALALLMGIELPLLSAYERADHWRFSSPSVARNRNRWQGGSKANPPTTPGTPHNDDKRIVICFTLVSALGGGTGSDVIKVYTSHLSGHSCYLYIPAMNTKEPSRRPSSIAYLENEASKRIVHASAI